MQSAIQEFFNDEEPTGPSTLMKQWNIELQCRAQSSQVKALRSEGQCIGRDSFAYGLETAGWLEANTEIVSLFKGICAADWVTYDIDDTTSLT